MGGAFNHFIETLPHPSPGPVLCNPGYTPVSFGTARAREIGKQAVVMLSFGRGLALPCFYHVHVSTCFRDTGVRRL